MTAGPAYSPGASVSRPPAGVASISGCSGVAAQAGKAAMTRQPSSQDRLAVRAELVEALRPGFDKLSPNGLGISPNGWGRTQFNRNGPGEREKNRASVNN